MRTFVSQADAGIHPIPVSARRSSRSDRRGEASGRGPSRCAVRGRQQRGGPVGQQVHVRLDALLAGLAEPQDAQRDPRVLGRDRDVDGRPVADRLATLGGRVGIEDGGEEDRLRAA